MTTATRPAPAKALPPHGTLSRAKYHRCPCEKCRDCTRHYQRTRYRQRGYGTWQPYVDAEPARQHLLTLHSAGISYSSIAEHLGRHTATVTALVYDLGPNRRRKLRVRPDFAEQILSLTAEALSPSRVDATGTARRLQALAAIGWPMRSLGRHIGVHEATVNRLTLQPKVYAATATAVTAAYERLRTLTPEEHGITRSAATRTRNWAAARGWRDPLWWEDMGRIDDPTFDPDTADRPLNRDELAAVRRGEVEHLLAADCTSEEIATRLGMSPGTVRQVVLEVRTGQRRDRKKAAV
ncbi:hypothetical protein [Streptomyces sp. NPDC047097]|uniref:hypothetical protein n=1 Tax=Streptomyces sp. NPDC047097 TaxID=3155260 RepID=UPI0033C099F0